MSRPSTKSHTKKGMRIMAIIIAVVMLLGCIPLIYADDGDTPVYVRETRYDWYLMFADIAFTGDWPTDVLMIAQTQLGYKESPYIYVEDSHGEKHGYTRYADWYNGDPFHAWCASFISFCLNFSWVPEEYFPRDCNCGSWKNKLKDLGYYHARNENGYVPQAGDIIFYDFNVDKACDHVALVYKVDTEEEIVYTIEGNFNNMVCPRWYPMGYLGIDGYGSISEACDKYYADKGEERPVVELVDAEELESSGLPEIYAVDATEQEAEKFRSVLQQFVAERLPMPVAFVPSGIDSEE